jgi:hypothetical protein
MSKDHNRNQGPKKLSILTGYFMPKLGKMVTIAEINRNIDHLDMWKDVNIRTILVKWKQYIKNPRQYFICSTAPRCIALHSAASHCTALHRTAQPWLHSAASHCTALHSTAQRCIALHCAASHCTGLHSTAQRCIALHSAASHCTALHSTDVLNKNGWANRHWPCGVNRLVPPSLDMYLQLCKLVFTHFR